MIGFSIHPEIISVHIPKTAGSSFHAILKDYYGWRLKHIQKQQDIARFSTGKKYRSNKPFVKAVHGHIRPHENWKRQYKKAKWVCWLRDPAERVVSAYYHLEKTQHLSDRNQRLFAELQPTILDFVRLEKFKGVTRIYQHFLGDFNPEDFAFIGRTEHFEKDLARFEKVIGANQLTRKNENIGTNKKHISAADRDAIKRELSAEYDIYNNFLKHHEL